MTLLMRHGEWEESKEREREDDRKGDVILPARSKAQFQVSKCLLKQNMNQGG